MSRRYQLDAADPNGWLWEGIDQYQAPTDPHSASYQGQSRYTGPDFRQVAAAEEDRFAGRTTRIDLVETEYGPAKRQWLAGWRPGYKPYKVGPLEAGWTVESAAAKLEADGWTVHRWPGGARAWRIDKRPVRNGEWMRRMRERMAAHPPAGVNVQAIDLLYDL